MSTNNQRRAQRIIPALDSYCIARHGGGGNGQIEGEEETDVRDLLTDLMHYCRFHTLDFDELVETAECNFDCESSFADDNNESEE